MVKQRMTVTLDIETFSKLLESLAAKRKQFPSRSELVEHAVKKALEEDVGSSAGGDAL